MKFLRKSKLEIDEELQTHLELQIRKHVVAGMPVEEARRQAAIEFGSVVAVREECREVFLTEWLDRAGRNVGHTFRSLRRNPVFATVAFVLLALGIGANVAVFSIIDALLFRPIPLQRPDEMVRIAAVAKDQHAGALPVAILPGLEKAHTFHGVCGMDTHYSAVEVAGSLHQLGIASFGGNCFRTLGLHLQLGRGIEPSDDRPGAAPVAMITDSFWRSTFGQQPNVLGQTIRFESNIYSIVGVTKPGFNGLLLGFPEPVMTPLHLDPDGVSWVNVLARRAPGVSPAQASAAIEAQSQGLLEASVPSNYVTRQRQEYLSQKLLVLPMRNGLDYFLRDRFSSPLYIAFALCATILLMTCVNLTSLCLARSLTRRREARIRVALGARPSHIATILLMENAVLLALAASAGTWGGLLAARILVLRTAGVFGNFELDIKCNPSLALFTGATVAVLLTIFGIAAVWQAQRLTRAENLHHGSRGIVTQNSVAQRILLAGQIALTLMLVSCAALLNTSLRNIYSIHFGVDARHVWDILLAPRPGANQSAAADSSDRDLLARIRALPGVASASISSDVPFERESDKRTVTLLDGGIARKSEIRAESISVGDGYLRALGIKLQAGQDFQGIFQRIPDQHQERCAIVSSALARVLAPNGDVIGRHIRIGDDPVQGRLKVIGIAADVRLNLADKLTQIENDKSYLVFLDWWQYPELHRYPILLVKTALNQLDRRSIQQVVDAGGREYVERIKTASAELDDALLENRILAYLSGAFSLLALGIAAVGLFGLLSYQVSSRFAEIGIRLALGAQRLQVASTVLRSVVGPLILGSGAGVLLIFGTQRATATLLYGTGPLNIGLLSASIGALALVAVLAALVPLRRACRIDPVKALAHE